MPLSSNTMASAEVQNSANNHSGYNLMMANERHCTTESKFPSKYHRTNHRHHKQYHSWTLSWIIFMVSMSFVQPQMIYRVDPLGKYLLILSYSIEIACVKISVFFYWRRILFKFTIFVNEPRWNLLRFSKKEMVGI